jgi:acetoin utilization deacetylase AcuC-like enzyme
VVPILRQFKPDLVLVSAGFDAHERDPLAGMRLTTGVFAAMTMELRSVAEACCGGRIAAVTEGGYDLRALAESLQGVVHSLGVQPLEPIPWPAPGEVAPSRGRATVASARRALAPFWAL